MISDQTALHSDQLPLLIGYLTATVSNQYN